MQGTLLIPCYQHGRQATKSTRRNGMITYNDSKYFNNIINYKKTNMINNFWIFAFFIIFASTTSLSEAREHYNGDVTPEDFVIDQLAALLQQHHLRQQQQQQREAAAAEAVKEPAVEDLSSGDDFSYYYPALPGGRESQHEPYFAVNPSDPRYYLPPQPLPLEEENDDASLAEPSWTGAGLFPSREQQHGIVEEREMIGDRALRGPNPGGDDGSIPGESLVPRSEEEEEDSSLSPQPAPPPKPLPNMILHPRRPTAPPAPQHAEAEHVFGEHHEPLPENHARIQQQPAPAEDDNSDVYFAAIVAGCSAAGVVTVIATGLCWYKLQRSAKAAADVEYPAYGVTGPNKDTSPTSGDRRLAQSAQMYHYQHQKQQIIAMESRAANERRGSMSEAESDEENEEGDYTVYECPGLAPTGEMEVKNPLFLDDPTPATPATPATPRSDDKSSDAGKKSPSTGSK